jgi:nucleosome assembly protein 1-like 1
MAQRESPPPEPAGRDEPVPPLPDAPTIPAAQDDPLLDPLVSQFEALPIPGAAPPQQYNFNFNVDATSSEEEDDEGDDDDDDDSDAVNEEIMPLPPALKRRVEYLKTLNEERNMLMNDYTKERAALELRYQDLCRPLFDKRKRLVGGEMDDEIQAESPPDLAEAEQEENHPEALGKGVPQFWVTAMGHMEGVSELIAEQDVECLEALTDITCTDHPNGNGFVLTFYFDTERNTYFTNPVLMKEYDIPNLLLEDEPILKDVRGCDIHWKAGRCLTHREIKKTQRAKSGKRAGQVRTVVKKEKRDSFFHFFAPPKMPNVEEMDEETADALEEAFDHDYDVAQAFRSHIIPKAVLWFTGEAMFEDADDEDSSDDDVEEEETEGDEDDEAAIMAGDDDEVNTSTEIDMNDDPQTNLDSGDGVYA